MGVNHDPQPEAAEWNPRDAVFWVLRLVIFYAAVTLVARLVGVDGIGLAWLLVGVAMAVCLMLVSRAIAMW